MRSMYLLACSLFLENLHSRSVSVLTQISRVYHFVLYAANERND